MKHTRKSIRTLLLGILLSGLLGITAFAAVDLNGTSYTTLDAAITAANTNGASGTPQVITLSGGIPFLLTGTAEIDAGIDLTILSQTAGVTETIFAPANALHFNLQGASGNPSKLTLQDIVLDGQTIGGGIYGQYASLTIDPGTEITGIKSGPASSPVYMRLSSQVIMNDGTIHDNTMLNGGAIDVHDSSELILNGGRIYRNTANNRGGAIYVYTSKLTIPATSTVIIDNNTAGAHGGAICLFGGASNDKAELEMYAGAIQDNKAYIVGGGICIIDWCDVTIGGTADISDNATTHGTNAFGGGIAAANNVSNSDVNLTISGGSITKNKSVTGGGIFFEYGNFLMTGGTIKDNQAPTGAGIMLDEFHTAKISGGIIESNDATVAGMNRAGGGIWTQETTNTLELSNVSIRLNKACEGGGVVALGPVRMTSGKIEGNTALDSGGGHGGGVYVASQFDFAGGNIYNNIADEHGGGVYLNGATGASFTMAASGALIGGNEADTGLTSGTAAGDDVYNTAPNTITLFGVPGSTWEEDNVGSRSRPSGGTAPYVNVGTAHTRTIGLRLNPPPTAYDVTYHNNLPTALAVSRAVVAGGTHSVNAYNAVFSAPPNGYVFQGWATMTGGSAVYTPSDSISVNAAVDLYAVWDYSVIYHENYSGATGSYADLVSVGFPQTALTFAATGLTAQSGYTFQGWATTSTGAVTYGAGASIPQPTAPLHLYAVWKTTTPTTPTNPGGGGGTAPNKVTYDPNGGKGGTTVNVTKGETHTVYTATKAKVSYDGYVLTNWNTKADGSGTAYAPNASFKVTGDETLYAQWTKGEEPPVIGLNTKDHFSYISGYPEGTVRPDNSITRAEVATIFYNLLSTKGTAAGGQFGDVAGDAWYANQVNYLASLGILTGYPDGSFRPDQPITRAEFASIAAKFDKLSPSNDTSFPDVGADHWALRVIQSAAAKGWVSGYPDGTFKPEAKITRAEVVSVVNKMLNRAIDDTALAAVQNPYSDIDKSHWAYRDIIEASKAHDYTRDENGKEIWDLAK